MPFSFYAVVVIFRDSAERHGYPSYIQEAGTASAILSVVKYVFAAVVSPLVGLADMTRS